MSLDTYFCFCCLSTNDLSPLYNDTTETSCATLLQDFFNVSISSEDYMYDSHICKDCMQVLNDTNKFKLKLFEIFNALENNGLIQVIKEYDKITIKKVTIEFLEAEEKYGVPLFDQLVQGNIDKPDSIKQEIDYNQEKKNSKQVTIERDNKSNVNKRERHGITGSQYEVTDDFKCQICLTVLPNLYTFHAHMNQEHYSNHICESCGKGFSTERRLKRHMGCHSLGPYKCQECNTEFTNYNTFNSHRQRKHSAVLLYKCPHCSQRFRTFARRATHLAEQHQMSTPKYSCKICSKKFLIAGNLSSHMRNKHFKVKKHTCSECGAAFSQRQDLAAHASTHTGQQKYHCDVCNKRYPRKKALIVHMRTHTNERRFGCEVCGKRFIQKCTLLVHANTHKRTDEKNKNNKIVTSAITVEYAFRG